MDKQEFLKSSIESRRVVAFYYKNRLRTVHPIAIKGSALHGWQVAGETSSGRNLPCYSNYSLDGIDGLSETGETFSSEEIGR